jgi:hypothetical protein
VPLVTATGAAMAVPLSKNCTVPVGVPPLPDVLATAAVSVTDWPNVDALGALDVIVVDVPAARDTVIVNVCTALVSTPPFVVPPLS